MTFFTPIMFKGSNSSRSMTASTTIFAKKSFWWATSFELNVVAAHFSKSSLCSLLIFILKILNLLLVDAHPNIFSSKSSLNNSKLLHKLLTLYHLFWPWQKFLWFVEQPFENRNTISMSNDNYTQYMYNNPVKITSEMQYNLTSLQVFKGVRTEPTWFVNPVSRLQLLYPLWSRPKIIEVLLSTLKTKFCLKQLKAHKNLNCAANQG